jgi:hypothetical protein
MDHGSALFGIESVEEGIYREGSHLPRVGGSADKSGEGAPPRPRGTNHDHLRLPGEDQQNPAL